jgi:hypothetical protein
MTSSTIINLLPNQDINSADYNNKDKSLLNGINIIRDYGKENDYIEQVLYDVNDNLLKINYSYSNQSIVSSFVSSDGLTTSIDINPIEDFKKLGYDKGQFKLLYNFFRKKVTDGLTNKFYIKNISADRTELRLSNNNISNGEIQLQTQGLINDIQNTAYYKDFLINFGDNKTFIVVNVGLELSSPQYSLLLKLYEPLPLNFNVKDQLWIVEKVADSIEYKLEAIKTIEPPQIPQLRSPNFDLNVNQELNQPSAYKNLNDLITDPSNTFYQELSGLLEEKSIKINVDYNLYENFVHFSSAKERLLNFVYKLELIEGYTSELSTLQSIPNFNSTTAVSGNIITINDKINSIITKFDGYERFLYFESGSVSGSNSNSWPKSTSNKPYVLNSVTSSEAINFLGSDIPNSVNYGGQIYSASYYDNMNQDNLVYTIPEFIRDNESNKNYDIFIKMIGQHFDNVWTYNQSITDLYKADNNITTGISKDLVFHALKSLGIKLYNNDSNNNLFNYLLGFNPDLEIPNPLNVPYTLLPNQIYNLSNLTIGSGGYLTVPSTTIVNINNTLTNNGTVENNGNINVLNYVNNGTLINNSIVVVAPIFFTSLINAGNITGENYEKEIYKRIYHNIPLLLKAKGTERGLRALIACYGIPDTILRISETGGADKLSASIEYDHNRFTYGFRPTGSIDGISVSYGSVVSPLFNFNTNFTSGSTNLPIPYTFELRFKPDPIYPTTTYSQSLYEIYSNNIGGITGSPSGSPELLLLLEKNPLIHTGLKKDYGYLKCLLFSGSIAGNYYPSASIEFPYFNGNVYNSLVQYESKPLGSSSITLYVKSNIGEYTDSQEGPYIGYSNSASINLPFQFGSSSFVSASYVHIGGVGPGNITGSTNTYFKGLLQEFRMWSQTLDESSFEYHTLNPQSYEGNTTGSAHETLVLRLPLGNDLKIDYNNTDYIISSHPASSPSYLYTSSFTNASLSGSYINGKLSQSFEAFTEQYYFNSPNTGILERISDKIRIGSSSIPNNVLSSFKRLEEQSTDLTQDLHLLEVAFSPQNEINDDITSQLGFFNIDDYIGDPQEDTSINYFKLEKLKEYYFKKYITNYNVFDYIRLIKYFDNSLFKMIKDFIPARVNSSTGIVIKPNILERNKIPRQLLEAEELFYSASIYSKPPSADSGGVLESTGIYFNNYSASIPGNFGNIEQIGTYNEEYYNGEFGGTIISTIKNTPNPFTILSYN